MWQLWVIIAARCHCTASSILSPSPTRFAHINKYLCFYHSSLLALLHLRYLYSVRFLRCRFYCVNMFFLRWFIFVVALCYYLGPAATNEQAEACGCLTDRSGQRCDDSAEQFIFIVIHIATTERLGVGGRNYDVMFLFLIPYHIMWLDFTLYFILLIFCK